MKRILTGAAAAALLLGLAPAALAQSNGGYTIGVSNTVQGNGWREEMICAMRAQAADSGMVDQLIVAHRNTDAAGQLEDLNNLIEAGVDAIVLNPANPDALNSALEAAMEAGIVVVAVDQGRVRRGRLCAVQQPGGIRLSRCPVAVRAYRWRGFGGLHARRGGHLRRQ